MCENFLQYHKRNDKEWRNKVKQFQTPIFSRSTKGAWVLRFDDILADALELGALRKDEISLSDEDIQAVAALTPKDIPNEVIHTLIAYYRANKPEDSDWVVLPVASFDAYFDSTNFSHKWLVKIPDTIPTREKQSFGVCRYKENYNVDCLKQTTLLNLRQQCHHPNR